MDIKIINRKLSGRDGTNTAQLFDEVVAVDPGRPLYIIAQIIKINEFPTNIIELYTGRYNWRKSSYASDTHFNFPGLASAKVGGPNA